MGAPLLCTPMIVAATHGHHVVVELLLAKGSSVNQAAVIYCMVGHGGVAGAAGALYHTPLLCAVENGFLKVVE